MTSINTFQRANPGLSLFIFVLFKHSFYRKNLGFSGIRTRIVRVEGEHADHLTTTTAWHQYFYSLTIAPIVGSHYPYLFQGKT